MTMAAVFPGQGSQYVGMGLDLAYRYPEVHEILDMAEDVCEQPLLEIIEKGPKDLLDDTIIAQPAIFTMNYVYWHLLKKSDQSIEYLAGHSLGELSASMAAGVFSFEDGLSIVNRRADLMAEAADASVGGMLAVIGLDEDKVVEISTAVGLRPANYNGPGQIVVSGPIGRLEQGSDAFKSAGAKRVVKLPVSGAFHSRAMAGPARRFARWLEDVPFEDPRIPIISNATAQPLLTGKDVKAALADQMHNPVRWQDCIERLVLRGVDRFIEVGPGRVLSGLIKRIAPEVVIEHAADRLMA